ncbi:hypothetical protein [Salirhabdus sp. Marseille-P4669]|nr:hypothetical protein [Salirhabdus sp. Marseille-P4669]
MERIEQKGAKLEHKKQYVAQKKVQVKHKGRSGTQWVEDGTKGWEAGT